MPPSSPSAARGYQIGEAAKRSGVSSANIRFYEKEQLLSPQGRGENSYRLYSEGDLHQLRFIRLCRAMDMSLDEVRTLLALDLNKRDDCAAAREALDGHLGHVRARLAELKALEKDLKALRNRCDGSDTHCHIIEALHELADAQAPASAGATGRKRHV
jgi:DNA-binding transcriptional MerR regulator